MKRVLAVAQLALCVVLLSCNGGGGSKNPSNLTGQWVCVNDAGKGYDGQEMELFSDGKTVFKKEKTGGTWSVVDKRLVMSAEDVTVAYNYKISGYTLNLIDGDGDTSIYVKKDKFGEFKAKEEKAEQAFERGNNFMENEKYDEAIAAYNEAIRLNPKHVVAYYFRSSAYDAKKDYDKAIADLTEFIRLLPKNGYAIYEGIPIRKESVYLARGAMYMEKKDYDKGIADFNEAIRLNPKFEQAYLFRGAAYIDSKKDYDKAIADYNQAIRLNPGNEVTYLSRGRAYDFKEDYDKAIADYNQAIRLNPRNVEAYLSRGGVYVDKKDYDKAIADYNQAIRLNPSNEEAYRYRGVAYVGKKDWDKAIADWNEAIRLNPKDGDAYNYRGYAYLEKKDYDKVIADFNEAIRLDPKNGSAYNGRGYAYLEKKDYDKAIADFNEAIRLAPNRGGFYGNRGDVYRAKKDYDRAIEDYTKALRLDTNLAVTYNNRGDTYIEKKDYDKAIADFEMAVRVASRIKDDKELKRAKERLAEVKGGGSDAQSEVGQSTAPQRKPDRTQNGDGSGFGGGGGGIDDLLGGLMGDGDDGNPNVKKRGELKVSSPDFMKGGALTGGRSRASIQRVVMQNMAALRYAYNRRLRDKPGLNGKINVKFAIDEYGKVIFAQVVESTMDDSELERTVVDRVKSWNFDKIDKPGDVTEVVYPFVFSQ